MNAAARMKRQPNHNNTSRVHDSVNTPMHQDYWGGSLQNSYREFDSHTRLQFQPLQFQRVVRVVVFGELL